MSKTKKKPVNPPKEPQSSTDAWKDAKTQPIAMTLTFTVHESRPLMRVRLTCEKCKSGFLTVVVNGGRLPKVCRDCGGQFPVTVRAVETGRTKSETGESQLWVAS